MSTTLQRVCITGTGSFLPNDPVPAEQIDDVLGHLTDAPPKVQNFIKTVGKRMLTGGGVTHRHFAVNPETHELTHTLTTLSEESARRALAMANRKPEEIDLLIFSSPSYEATTPPTTTLLQQQLGIPQCAELEIHSNCAGVGKAVQVAYDALRLGRYRTALVVYSQLSSVYLRACYFNQAAMNKTQAMLRYILADGTGALVLEGRPDDTAELPGEVIGAYVESVGCDREPGMTAGGGVADATEGLNPTQAIFERGSHHLDQDFFAVNRDAGPFLLEGALRLMEAVSLNFEQIDHFIWSIPTHQLLESNRELFSRRLPGVMEKAKFRATHCGYTGGASILIHLDEMVQSGELQRGQTALLHSVESSKWMTAGFVVRW